MKTGEPLLPGPDRQPPTPAGVEAETTGWMQAAGIDPAYIYAFQQTGFILAEDNLHTFGDEDIDACEDALDRYYALHADSAE